ncbi:hypothetical protein KsCSTR_18260 [Candidatus Kuenenia stuttgartiensis]|uniref:Uncharacterized protein n=1 Tax=Kuenenia stuttgartiensis TaxID=174633 RepID=A0A6G7GPC0_KUEST|nr:hypothetical protein KsCSTR_18260 [Candidatus Kuenenia stuttgartiensis]
MTDARRLAISGIAIHEILFYKQCFGYIPLTIFRHFILFTDLKAIFKTT